MQSEASKTKSGRLLRKLMMKMYPCAWGDGISTIEINHDKLIALLRWIGTWALKPKYQVCCDFGPLASPYARLQDYFNNSTTSKVV